MINQLIEGLLSLLCIILNIILIMGIIFLFDYLKRKYEKYNNVEEK